MLRLNLVNVGYVRYNAVWYVVMLSEVSHVVLPIGSRPGGSWGNNRDFLAPGPPLGDILPGEYDPGDV